MGQICASVYDLPGVQQWMDYMRMKFLSLYKVYLPLSKMNLALSSALDKVSWRPQGVPHQGDQCGRAMQPSGIFWTLRERTISRRLELPKQLRRDSALPHRGRWSRQSSRPRFGCVSLATRCGALVLTTRPRF